MTTQPVISELAVGQEIGRRTVELSRDTLVRYAGASGDFNPIHYNDDAARSAGLDGVIAHGMLTMGTAIDVVAQWAGDPTAIRAYSVRFTRPVPVPALETATLEITAVIGAIDPAPEQHSGATAVRVDLTVHCGGVAVLGRARATVVLTGSGDEQAHSSTVPGPDDGGAGAPEDTAERAA